MSVTDRQPAGDGTWVVADHDGFVIAASPEFCTTFAWPAARLLGQPIAVLVPSSLRSAHHMGFSRFVASGRSSLLDTPLPVTVLTGDGRALPVEMTLRAEQRGARWTITAEVQSREAA